MELTQDQQRFVDDAINVFLRNGYLFPEGRDGNLTLHASIDNPRLHTDIEASKWIDTFPIKNNDEVLSAKHIRDSLNRGIPTPLFYKLYETYDTYYRQMSVRSYRVFFRNIGLVVARIGYKCKNTGETKFFTRMWCNNDPIARRVILELKFLLS